MSNVEALIQKQTKTQDLIQCFMKNTKKTKTSSISKGFITSRVDLLRLYFQEYYNRHEQLGDLVMGDDKANYSYFLNDEFATTKRCFSEAMGGLNDWLESLQPPPPSLTSHRHSTFQEEGTFPPFRNDLPKIVLPKFTGNYLEWQPFSNLFLSLVADNPTIPDVHKLHHLKTALSGEAAEIVANYKVTAANFDLVWTILKKRYENPTLLLTSYLNEWLAIPPVKDNSVRV